MSNTVISVEHLSKRYRLGVINTGTFKDDLKIWFAKSRGKENPLAKIGEKDYGNREGDILWALKDVNFTVQRGEALGIIGRNGAGKSTLLKILSRVTTPTEGHVHVKGRIASLLEVGTGFHPELTGRENIYLNGAIMGMDRVEVTRKFDEIVDFSGVEKFIDTPVKRYSSGMYVRLAFAVAAHLEPEILIVDEVLAVGDAEFQKKCLGKMGDVAHEGRTVLFVSHNMVAIQTLCEIALRIESGRIRSYGKSSEVITEYLTASLPDGVQESPGKYKLSQRENPYLPGNLIAQKLYLMDAQGNIKDIFLMGQEMRIVVDVQGMSDHRNAVIGVIIKTKSDQWITTLTSGMSCSHIDEPRIKNERAILRIPKIPLVPGSYWIDITIAQQGIGRLDYVDRAATFTIAEADVYGNGYQISSYFGLMYLEGNWEIAPLDTDCEKNTK